MIFTLYYEGVPLVRGCRMHLTYWRRAPKKILGTEYGQFLNVNHTFTVSVIYDNLVVGHLPKEIQLN